MGMTSVIRKVLFLDLIQGLKVTFRYQDPKEIYTEQYPLERPQVAERYRGAPRLNVNAARQTFLASLCRRSPIRDTAVAKAWRSSTSKAEPSKACIATTSTAASRASSAVS